MSEDDHEQIRMIKDEITNGNPEAAWQLIEKHNNPHIYEGLLEDCPVDENGWVTVEHSSDEDNDDEADGEEEAYTKNADDTTLTLARPPVYRPATTVATSTKNCPRPIRCANTPNSTK